MPELAPTPPDVIADRRLGHLRAVLVDQPLPDPLRGMTLLPRRLPIGFSQPSINGRYGPSRGAGRTDGDRFTGGDGEASACLTARR
jgi:hypothetical protein